LTLLPLDREQGASSTTEGVQVPIPVDVVKELSKIRLNHEFSCGKIRRQNQITSSNTPVSKQQYKVGNLILEIPDLPGINIDPPKPDSELITGRGEEVKPISTIPSIPNPNDFVGASLFQATAIGKVGSSDKKWVNTTGVLVFFGLPLAFFEAITLRHWIVNGSWGWFVALNAGLGIALWLDKRGQKK
jgi:hypothetical protein